jgi:hypothetical protein
MMTDNRERTVRCPTALVFEPGVRRPDCRENAAAIGGVDHRGDGHRLFRLLGLPVSIVAAL